MNEPGPRYELVAVGERKYRVYELYWRELREVIRSALKVRSIGGENTVDFDLVAYVDSLLRRGLRDETGNPVNVDELTRREYEVLVAKLYELNPFVITREVIESAASFLRSLFKDIFLRDRQEW